MAFSEDQESYKLSQIYDDGMNMFEDINKSQEATNSNNIQVQIRKTMRLFEDATRLVSLSEMFSSNESIEEVPTKNIRYLLLPALLGTLSLKLCGEDRKNVVETAEIYFRDYLTRCKNYEIIDYEIPEHKENDISDTSETPEISDTPETSSHQCMPNLLVMAVERNKKIQKYKEKKELENEVDNLKKLMSDMDIADEETERKYYLTVVKNYAAEALDELSSLEMEKQILEHMAKIKKGQNSANSTDATKKLKYPPKPLKPIIITRDELQKKVFGAGYPSLPTLTVQEFYEKRIKDGDWPDPSKQKLYSLQDMAMMESSGKEQEAIEKEKKMDGDDPKYLQEARDWDEFKDDHRRGWGNRMNRS